MKSKYINTNRSKKYVDTGRIANFSLLNKAIFLQLFWVSLTLHAQQLRVDQPGTLFPSGAAVLGHATAMSGQNFGVFGESSSPDGWGVYSCGQAHIAGDLSVGGTLTKMSGSFKIDHPLDPMNKYLLHSFVESPDMMNIYNGNVVTDRQGFGAVILPEWFDTLNRDFQYQLTVIGKFAQAIILEEINDNSFIIQTSLPDTKVSWQVTGVRKDPYANAFRIPVEVSKSDQEKGTYLFPAGYDQPREKGLHYSFSLGPGETDLKKE
jgi:hypothetical protein